MRRFLSLGATALLVAAVAGCGGTAKHGGGPGVEAHNRSDQRNPLAPAQAAANVVQTHRTLEVLCTDKQVVVEDARRHRLHKLIGLDINALRNNPNGDIQPAPSSSQLTLRRAMIDIRKNLQQCGLTDEASRVQEALQTTSAD